MKRIKPWTDKDGNTLPDSKLKTISKKWSAETWEAYLQSIEHEEPNMVFLSIKGDTIEQTATEDFRALVSDPRPLKEALLKDVRGAVNSLSPRKKEIIKNSYWEEISERDQALHSNVLRSAIYQQKKRAKKQAKNFLLKNSKNLGSWTRKR